MNDSRIRNGHNDVKAGTAAFDDARSAWRELLEESPKMPERYRQMLEANCVALSRIVMRANAIIGSTTRILEETDGGAA